MGGEGAGMFVMKNHEGYTDMTAGKAIRRADSSKFRRRGRKTRPLTYRIGEVPGFPVTLVKCH